MYVKMFAFGIIVLYVISFVEGGTVTIGSNDVKGIEREVVKDILSHTNGVAIGDILKALNDIEELKTKSDFLEQKVLSLERQDREKDKIIRSVQKHMHELWESDLRKENVKNRTDLASENSRNANTETKTFTRKKRQIAVPTVPTAHNIAFSAYLTHTHSNLSPGQTIIFDHIMLNDGHGYNSYKGIFTAPISGTYLFTFHFHTRVHTFVRLNVDGANIVDAVSNPHTTNTHDRETMGGNTVVIHVGIGQAVSVEVYDVSGEAASSDKYRLCTFSGFLLYPE